MGNPLTEGTVHFSKVCVPLNASGFFNSLLNERHVCKETVEPFVELRQKKQTSVNKIQGIAWHCLPENGLGNEKRSCDVAYIVM